MTTNTTTDYTNQLRNLRDNVTTARTAYHQHIAEANANGLSTRTIANILGVSHQTIHNIIKTTRS